MAVNQDGIIRQTHFPKEIQGMELVELTKEIEELFVFEDFLSKTLMNGHKPVSAYYKFAEYLEATGKHY